MVGGLLLFGREQEFHILKIIFAVRPPVAFIWVCCSSFRLMLKAVASRFAKAQGALAKGAIHTWWRSRLKVAGCLAAVTVVSFLYFAGLIDLKLVQGFQLPFSQLHNSSRCGSLRTTGLAQQLCAFRAKTAGSLRPRYHPIDFHQSDA